MLNLSTDVFVVVVEVKVVFGIQLLASVFVSVPDRNDVFVRLTNMSTTIRSVRTDTHTTQDAGYKITHRMPCKQRLTHEYIRI